MKQIQNFTDQELKDELSRREEEKRVSSRYNKLLDWAPSPIGIWKVTTEGDCGGLSTKDLGVFEGHVVDIARKLAHKAYYSLSFETSPPLEELADPAIEPIDVHIQLGIRSGTWATSVEGNKLTPMEITNMIKRWLESAPSDYDYTDVNPGQYYASTLIKFKEK